MDGAHQKACLRDCLCWSVKQCLLRVSCYREDSKIVENGNKCLSPSPLLEKDGLNSCWVTESPRHKDDTLQRQLVMQPFKMLYGNRRGNNNKELCEKSYVSGSWPTTKGKKETTEMWLDDASGGADSEKTRTVWWCSWRKQTCSIGHAVSEEVGIQLKLC